jgi:flagellum-specific ATP synthase
MQMLEENIVQNLARTKLSRRSGRLVAIQGVLAEAVGFEATLGELVYIKPLQGAPVPAEAVGLREERVQLMPYGSLEGLSLACDVEASGQTWAVPVGRELLGRVLDPAGKPLDDGPALPPGMETSGRHAAAINPLHRARIDKPLHTGVKAVDWFTPLGQGQRIGIFAGSGVGKSTLLGMVSRQTSADIVVIALIGERGREVGDFIHENLSTERRARTVMVAASADQPAVLRRQAAYSATCIAEWFRDQGSHVLLIMDSVTRFALAQREIGLATGEPVGSRGYPASCFSLLPPLLERAGNISGKGSITGIYTVLVEGDDMNEPVADHMRAILDGHIVLSRKLAEKNHYPAIDVLKSISRLAGNFSRPEQAKQVAAIRHALSVHQDHADFIELGAYQKGSNPALDRIIALRPVIDAFLTQSPAELSEPVKVETQIQALVKRLESRRTR